MNKSILIIIIGALATVSNCKNEYSDLPNTGPTLNSFDLNQNGLYETNELSLVCNATPKGPTLITQAQLTKADKNKDGYITIDELEVLFYSSPPGWIPCK